MDAREISAQLGARYRDHGLSPRGGRFCVASGWTLYWQQNGLKRTVNPDALFALTDPRLPEEDSAGMRPGEIFAMKWSRLKYDRAEVKQRLYRGDFDSAKTTHSLRTVALSVGVMKEIEAWTMFCPDTNPDAWVFRRKNRQVAKDNVWRRHMAAVTSGGIGVGQLSGNAADAFVAHK